MFVELVKSVGEKLLSNQQQKQAQRKEQEREAKQDRGYSR
jgi:hypothetical protein